MRGWWRRPSRPSPAPAATSPGPARPATSRTPRSSQRGRPSSGRGSSPAPSVTRSRTGMTLMTAWRRLIMTRTTAGWREILKPLRLSRENNRSVECPVSGGVSCSMLSSEQGTLLSVLELHWRPDAGLHQPRRGVEAVHTEAAGRGKLPSQLSWRLGDLLLQGLHCKWVKHTANCTAWTCAVLNDLLFLVWVWTCLQWGSGLEEKIHHRGRFYQRSQQFLWSVSLLCDPQHCAGQVQGAALHHHVRLLQICSR